ncbi:MAG: efflux RND transporter periplasmic adaptor subunit [Vulcanimicrobiota bacterium]
MKKLLLITVSLLCLIACGQPPQPAEEEHHHEEEAEAGLHLEPAQQKEAGIALASPTMAEVARGIELSAVLVPDPDRQVIISSQLDGRVHKLFVQLGERVQVGQALVAVDSTELARLKAEYHQSRVESSLAENNLETSRQLAALGDETRRPLEEASAEVIAAQAAEARALADLEAHQKALARLERLLDDGIASRQQAEAARAEVAADQAALTRARADLQLARKHQARESEIANRRLRQRREVWQAQASASRSREELRHSEELLELLGASPETHESLLELRAPIGGLVTSRPARRGQTVKSGEELLTVTDLSELWVWVDLYDRDLPRVSEGMQAMIRVQAYPDRTFHGRLDLIDTRVDSETRTARGLVKLRNREALLKPGMYAGVELLSQQAEPGLTVPADAVTTVEGTEVVYVQVEPDHFERRLVRLGNRREGRVEVLEGLNLSDRVVISGVFALKSVDLRSSIGGHHH